MSGFVHTRSPTVCKINTACYILTCSRTLPLYKLMGSIVANITAAMEMAMRVSTA
jgi:hypothetical protein